MENERVTRRALMRVVLLSTANTSLAPSPAECSLLDQFLRGVITLGQVRWLVEERIQTTQAINQLRQLVGGAIHLQAQ